MKSEEEIIEKIKELEEHLYYEPISRDGAYRLVIKIRTLKWVLDEELTEEEKKEIEKIKKKIEEGEYYTFDEVFNNNIKQKCELFLKEMDEYFKDLQHIDYIQISSPDDIKRDIVSSFKYIFKEYFGEEQNEKHTNR